MAHSCFKMGYNVNLWINFFSKKNFPIFSPDSLAGYTGYWRKRRFCHRFFTVLYYIILEQLQYKSFKVLKLTLLRNSAKATSPFMIYPTIMLFKRKRTPTLHGLYNWKWMFQRLCKFYAITNKLTVTKTRNIFVFFALFVSLHSFFKCAGNCHVWRHKNMSLIQLY